MVNRDLNVGTVKYPDSFSPYKSYPQRDMCAYPTIQKRWKFSAKNLKELNAALTKELDEFQQAEKFCIITAGSYGRMEANEGSDLDFMIFGQEAIDEETAIQIIKKVQECATKMSIPLPKTDGVFSKVTLYNELSEQAGSDKDTLESVAQRMLMIMEARPLYNETVFFNAQDLILRKYLAFLAQNSSKEAVYLLNDAMRYFRSICVNYQFNFWRQEDKWGLRNIKLRHSRVIMYAGLLFTLLNASTKQYKESYIRDMMPLTPLERIVSVYQDASDTAYKRILEVYDLFLMKVQNNDVKKDLQVDYEDRYSSDSYREMKVTSTALSAELTRFIFSQRGRWSESVFEYLFF